jgi:hypothetical protein
MNSVFPNYAVHRAVARISSRRADSILAFGLLAQVYYLVFVSFGWGILAVALLRVVSTLMGK